MEKAKNREERGAQREPGVGEERERVAEYYHVSLNMLRAMCPKAKSKSLTPLPFNIIRAGREAVTGREGEGSPWWAAMRRCI